MNTDIAKMIASIKQYTLLSQDRIISIADKSAKVTGIDGDIAELGVYQGGISRMLAICNPDKVIHLYDTFEGIPVQGKHDVHKVGDFNTSLKEVKRLLADCNNVEFHQGYFTAETKVADRFSLVHLDGDQYESTINGIKVFWPKLSLGGCIIFDDYEWQNCPGVKTAIQEFFTGRTDFIFEVSARFQATAWKVSKLFI